MSVILSTVNPLLIALSLQNIKPLQEAYNVELVINGEYTVRWTL